jgi:ADP-heptose:LPS heptosyltransferase
VNRPLLIGVGMVGAMGDILNTSALLVGLKRKFPQSRISVFAPKGIEVLFGNEVVSEIRHVANLDKALAEELSRFDILCEIRYPVKYTFSKESLEFPEVFAFKTHWETLYKKHYQVLFETFLSDIKLIENFCKKRNISIYDLRRESSCLDYTDNDQFIDVNSFSDKASKSLDNMRMVVINNSGVAGKMTKSWTIEGWSKVIKHLKRRGLYVVQLGTKKEPPIPDVHERFYGTPQETASVIKKSVMGIFIEGGLAHLAKAVKKKSIVIFGPTPVELFGYKDNINLRGSECRPCWHPKDVKFDWNKTCALTGKLVDEAVQPCMQSLPPQAVIDAIDSILIENKMLVKKGSKDV